MPGRAVVVVLPDLSRQHVPVSDDPDDYNANLIRRAARLVCSQLIPMIRQQGVEAVLRLFERESGGDHAGAAALLHRAITDELADMPLIPTERGDDLTLREVVLPSALLDSEGEQFRRAVKADATWEAREFPTRCGASVGGRESLRTTGHAN